MKRKISLSKKILIVNFVSIIICTFSISLFSYTYISTYLKDSSYKSNVQTMDQAANVMEELLSNLVKRTHFIIENELFQETLDKVLFDETYNYASSESIFKSLFESIRLKDRYYRYLYLYTRKGSFWEGQGYDVHIEDFFDSDIYKRMEETGLIAWTNGQYKINEEDSPGISFVLTVPTTRTNNTNEAFLYVKLNQYKFEKYLKSLNHHDASTSFIVDENFGLVASDYTTAYEEVIASQEFRNKVDSNEKGYFTFKSGRDNKVVTYASIPYVNWKIVNIQPESGLMSEVDYIKSVFVVIVLLSAFISIAISVYISRKITHPLIKLTKKIKRIEHKNLNERMEIFSDDEIGDLATHYNFMLDRIQNLIVQIEKEQQGLKKMEIDLLQSQINPHFLYNTLETTYWKVQLGENEVAGQMILWLSRMLRIGLSKGEEKITIKEELEHIDNYLKLQQVAYNNKFSYTILCDEGIKQFKTLKIIIQPIVENSVNHGFNTIEEGGRIQILVEDLDENTICMTVIDNGTGIDEDLVLKGYALQNIMKRLKLYYGDNYGINIVGTDNAKGATVKIRIPKEK